MPRLVLLLIRRSIAFPPCSIVHTRKPRPPSRGFLLRFMRRRPRGGRQPSGRRAGRSRRGRRAPAPPRRGARAFRVPFAGGRPEHRAGIELAAIDAYRAAEAAADLERRLDDGVARQARRHRFEIGEFAGRAAAGYSGPPRSVRVRCVSGPLFYAGKRSGLPAYCPAQRG